MMWYRGSFLRGQPMLFLSERLSNQSRDAGTLLRGGRESFGRDGCVALGPSTDGLYPLVMAPVHRDPRCTDACPIYRSETRGQRSPSMKLWWRW